MDTKVADNNWIGKRTIRPDGADKVTGRATFGADFSLPGMLWGKVLRSPHPHAIIKSINLDKAAALPGVKAVMCGDDLANIPLDKPLMVGPADMRFVSRNVMARDKVLYAGHAVAAVAAISNTIASAALELIEVDYEILPHVIDVEDAMQPDAPVLHDFLRTGGVTPKPETASNIANRLEFKVGDLDAGFAAADVIVERSYRTKPIHQGYIEPHACLISMAKDGQATIWSSSQGHFMVRNATAKMTGMSVADIRAIPAEIGGGFGGKTIVYLEPLAMVLARKSGSPVKMVMSREEIFRATGPTSGSWNTVRIGATKDGKITAGSATFRFQAGAFPGAPARPAAMCAFAPYDIENVESVGIDVVMNRPKSNAYRAPGAPIAAHAVESTMDELADKLGLDPVEFRLQNAAKEGSKAAYGPTFKKIGFVETLEAAKAHAHYSAPLGPNQGRGVACGFWFNVGGESSAQLHINEDGTATIITGHPDIGGSRASMVNITAEMLGVDYRAVRAQIGDTNSIGISATTGGSRVTFSAGMAVTQVTEKVITTLRERAAMIWEIDVEAVVWEDGEARPAGSNAGEFEPLSLGDLAAKANATGGPINGQVSINAQGAAPAFTTHVCDVEVDPDTGHVAILRYTAVQDAGRAIHPSYVEGQIQGGVAQGVGWALNEEYIYDDNGQLENAGFLDYRMPVASDLPMIEAVVVEIPNDAHPHGVRGVGEVPIAPPMAAIGNAIANATGLRLSDLPMSPPKVLAALDEQA
ncbi:MAG: xanthine dehydrogenase family protein molybdopterin-binding subunit [Rhodospirillaceae bacterium]|jgi:CO/xanthine dehydrogenase Mo-binding subunit|nr:xanthine dehydrogenase family protein molybdopterin-binding subunit [Rhodospirillaceae bacterium]MBT6426145.1 xanthine dehydrogenase family protein molybdopterin-binding subunit [Rhodospirillaceae bacterium]